jgi:hypothetical protein
MLTLLRLPQVSSVPAVVPAIRPGPGQSYRVPARPHSIGWSVAQIDLSAASEVTQARMTEALKVGAETL